MATTRFGEIVRDFAGQMHREVRIACTPVPRGKTWLFVVGCYNSGTTLLASLLGEHAQIAALPTEGHFITDEFVKDFEIGLPRMWVAREDLFCLTEEDTGPDPQRIKKEWAMRLDRRRPVYLEKSPPNTAKTRWLQAHFERAHFVGLVRNGYAVAEGIRRKSEPSHRKAGWTLEEAAWQWVRSNEILKADAAHLRRFQWVTYEELAAEPQAVLDRIARFVGLQPQSEFRSGQAVTVHERSEPVRDLNEDSIARLSREELDTINAVAADQLTAFGYPLR